MNKKVVIAIVFVVIIAAIIGYFVWQKQQDENRAEINIQGVGKMKITDNGIDARGVDGGSFKMDENGIDIKVPN